ncbi:unnamed protein product [Didymodactylos carnosus]|uniref:Aminopeptidase NAALADL1 n=1 Tax=Didymodactylos carnosus TaxID=1234261 RepID=A0A814K4Z7_9BILA|nr:unnamed protein product [Didymodactylos carnosus]CAF3816211.1 unnamed protein product [Didymodactylos carnosus]
MAGTPDDLRSANVIFDRWKNDGLTVFKPSYNVLLSYPNNETVNRVIVRNGATILVETEGKEKIYDPQLPPTVNPFLAYTPNGTFTSSNLYYANYGRLEDFENLIAKVSLTALQNSTVICRYGKIFRGDKVMHAQQFGAKAAILYNDPQDYAPFGTTQDVTYNNTWFLPDSGAQRGSSYTSNGDPLTPIYPSKDYMFHLNEDIDTLPKIPAQPISYTEARDIMQYMTGEDVPDEWKGAMTVPYKYGGPLNNSNTITVTSYNKREPRDTYNVIGIMEGEIEPGFKPRRSLMFCSWGAEEYGLIGSVEWVQEYVKVLSARIVSYLNLDVAVEGNWTVDVKSSPLLYNVIVDAAKTVPSAYDGSKTVHDKWMEVHNNEPKIEYGLGSGSDFLAFDQLAGSSNFDTSYGFDPKSHGNLGSYPLYHTSYEVFSMVEKFVDPEFKAHQTMGQFTGALALRLSESALIPFSVEHYTKALNIALADLEKEKPLNTNLTSLKISIDEYGAAAVDFVEKAKDIDKNNPYAIRVYNDQLLQLERAFINPHGLASDTPDFKHIIYAPSKGNQYAASGFPSITGAFATGDSEEIKKQISIATYFIKGATSVLKQPFNFITD